MRLTATGRFASLIACGLALLASATPPARADDPKQAKQVVDTYVTAMSMAYPPAGAVFGAFEQFLDMTGYFGSSPDPVGEAISRINVRLDALEQRVSSLEAQLNQDRNERFRDENLARVRRLRDLKRELSGVLLTLGSKPADEAGKRNLALAIANIAGEFVTDRDLWTWSDLVVKDHVWDGQAVKAGQVLPPDFKPMPTMEYYAATLIAWMAALDYGANGDPGWIKRNHLDGLLQQHLDYLSVRPGWTKFASPPQTLPEQIMSRIVTEYRPEMWPVNHVGHVDEYTRDALAREIRYIQTLTYPAASDNEMCNVPAGLLNQEAENERALEGAYGTTLTAELARRLTRLRDLGTVREQEPIWETTPIAPPGPTFYVTFLYGLRPDGQLVWYRHEGARSGEVNWQGPRMVGQGWQRFKFVFPGGGNTVYAVTTEGQLVRFQHNDFHIGAGIADASGAAAQPAAVFVTGRDRLTGRPRVTPAPAHPPGAGSWSGPTVAGSDTPLGPAPPAARPMPVSYGGAWDLTAGSPDGSSRFVVTLQQSGTQVTGTYGAADAGKIQGTVTGRDLAATWRWSNGDTGVVLLTLSDDANSITGHWRYGSATATAPWRGTWNGQRQGTTSPRTWANYRSVFAGGDGIIYAITQDGRLLWYRHDQFISGSAGTLEGPKEVGQGWDVYKHVFSAGNGYIYAIDAAGKLYWWHHLGFADGTPQWKQSLFLQRRQVGEGWGDFTQVFSAGPIAEGVLPQGQTGAVIYAVDKAGKLWWFAHLGYDRGNAQWLGPKAVGEGWGDYAQALALIPATPPPGGGIH